MGTAAGVVVWAASRVSSPRGPPPAAPHYPATPMAHEGLMADLEWEVCGLELDVRTGMAEHPKVAHSCWLRRERVSLMQLSPADRVRVRNGVHVPPLVRRTRIGDGVHVAALVRVDPPNTAVFFRS